VGRKPTAACQNRINCRPHFQLVPRNDASHADGLKSAEDCAGEARSNRFSLSPRSNAPAHVSLAADVVCSKPRHREKTARVCPRNCLFRDERLCNAQLREEAERVG
jgi:hypothetical protein